MTRSIGKKGSGQRIFFLFVGLTGTENHASVARSILIQRFNIKELVVGRGLHTNSSAL